MRPRRSPGKKHPPRGEYRDEEGDEPRAKQTETKPSPPARERSETINQRGYVPRLRSGPAHPHEKGPQFVDAAGRSGRPFLLNREAPIWSTEKNDRPAYAGLEEQFCGRSSERKAEKLLQTRRPWKKRKTDRAASSGKTQKDLALQKSEPIYERGGRETLDLGSHYQVSFHVRAPTSWRTNTRRSRHEPGPDRLIQREA